MSRKLILVIGLIVATSSPVFAQYYTGHRGTATEQAACRRDALHLCRGLTDDSQVQSCLVSHWARVSRGCQRVLASHR